MRSTIAIAGPTTIALTLPSWIVAIWLVILGMVLLPLWGGARNAWENWNFARSDSSSSRSEKDRLISYGLKTSLPMNGQIYYEVQEPANRPVDAQAKLQKKREFAIEAGELFRQLEDILWLIDVPAIAIIPNEGFPTAPAFKGVFTGGEALDIVLKNTDCTRQITDNAVVQVFCKDRYRVDRLSAAQKDNVQVLGIRHETRLIGDTHCARTLVDACVDENSKHIFIPQGDATETVLAFDRINRYMKNPIPQRLLYSKDLAGHQTAEINGVFSADEALNLLLAGSGLAQHSGNGWTVIVPAHQALERDQTAKL